MKSNYSLRTSSPVKFTTWSLGLSAAGLISAVPAATLTWDASGANPAAPTDGSGTWDASAVNWSSGAADLAWPNTNADVAVFGANNGAAGAITVGTVTANGITFNAAGSGSYALSGGTLTLDGVTPTLTSNVDASIASVIAGGAGLTKAGTGTLTLSGTNTYTGGTSVNAGTLTAKQPGTAVNTVAGQVIGAGAVSVPSGGTLYLDDDGNGTTGSERILQVGNALTGTGAVQLRPSAVMTNGWSAVSLAGDLSSFGGTLNVLPGSTANRGKVRFAYPSQAAVITSAATINVQAGATLYLNQAYNYGAGVKLYGAGNVENLGALRLENAGTQTGPVTLLGNSFIGGNGSAVTISGAIDQSGGRYGFTKQGNNTLTLSNAANTYTGGTTVTGGTLSIGNATALSGTGNLTMSGGSLSTAVAASLANNITLNNGSTFTAAGGTLALNGNVTGSPTGNWNLTATNKITLAGSNVLGIAANFGGVNVSGAGGVDVTGSTTINGPATNTFNGALSAAGNTSVTVQSGGSLTVNGSSHASQPANTPNTIIGQNAAGTSTLAINGGSLTVGGNTGFVLGNNVATAIGVMTISSGTVTINRGSTTATDLRSFISLGRDNATGTINLNGGTLATDRNFVHDGSNGGTAGAGTSNFIFGGGTLKALANQSDWLNSTSINGSQLPLTSVTATAPSTIDSNGFGVGVNSAISGEGGLTIIDSSGSGNGVVTFGGAKTYTGGTQVTGGTLAVTGTLAGAVSVSTAGRLAVGEAAPSSTMASLSLDTLTLGTGGAIKFDVDTVGSNDQLTIATPSGLTISGGGVYLCDAGTTNALAEEGTYTLVNFSGTLNGSVSGLSVVNGLVGYAYTFADTGSAITVTVALTNDTDGDGMTDAWEDANGLNKLVNDANGNADGDFATNLEEFLAGTNPQSASADPNNTDNDGLRDSWEISYFETIAAQSGTGDPDGDYATNAQEQTADTDPTSRTSAPDSDFDGMGDAWELHYFPNLGTATAITDNDGDTYPDVDEFFADTNPADALQTPDDTDSDGLSDNWESSNFTNITEQNGTGDPDGDYATNEEEETADTSPTVRTSAPDGDGDGIGDAWEVHHFTNATTATATSDADSDTSTDLAEFLANTNPLNNQDPYSGTAVITWDTPVTVTADTDILTSGTLLHAGNFRSDNLSVAVTVGSQTITFENRQSQNAAGTLLAGEEARVIAASGGRQVLGTLFDATGTTVGAAFESVLDGSAWEDGDAGPAPGATDMIFRVTGVDGAPLVTGQQYRIQLFYSDDRGSSSTRAQVFRDDMGGGNDSAVMNAGDSKYVVGTFTASGAGYQDIHIRNTSGEASFPVAINAYVLRTVAAGDTDGDGMPDAWETANGLDPNTDDAAGDLDGDGTDNFGEFAFKGAANNGASRGVNTSALQDTNANSQKELTLTIATRTGATFAAGVNGTQVATADGVAYTVRGSLDLAAFTSNVAHVSTTASDDSDYELHTFRLTSSEGLAGKGFLQAAATAP